VLPESSRAARRRPSVLPSAAGVGLVWSDTGLLNGSRPALGGLSATIPRSHFRSRTLDLRWNRVVLCLIVPYGLLVLGMHGPDCLGPGLHPLGLGSGKVG